MSSLPLSCGTSDKDVTSLDIAALLGSSDDGTVRGSPSERAAANSSTTDRTTSEARDALQTADAVTGTLPRVHALALSDVLDLPSTLLRPATGGGEVVLPAGAHPAKVRIESVASSAAD